MSAIEELAARCEAIEAGYEFMLAYAGQGLPVEPAGSASGGIRDYLQKLDAAVVGLGDQFRSAVRERRLEPASRYEAFLAVLDRDARDAQAAVQLALAQPSISSQLVDNLNASIHVRALLTDLFLVDEIIKAHLH
jgi:DNA polymerase III delta prime subunit